MRYKTDLDAVKHVAVSLLHTHINETKFSPMVVQHPFTSSGFVGINSNGEMELLNILESAESKNKWQEFMEKQITNADSVYRIFMMVNKPYALTFLKLASKHLSFDDFSRILEDAWVMSENPNGDANVTKSELIEFFMAADPEVIMTPEERKQLDELDDTVFGLFLTLGSTIGSYFEIKKEGILGDSVKTSFVRRLKNPKYRQSIISKIIEAKDSGQEFRISNQDICRIFIDIEKAEKNLPKSTYNRLRYLYDINTLAKHKNGQSEWEQFNYRRSQESKTTIEDEESYYELLVSILTPYHKIASLDKYSGFNKRECTYVIEQIEKAEKEHREFISQIQEVITPTADYDENTIEQRLSVLTWDQKERIAMQLEEIYHMKEFSKKSSVYLSNHTIEGMIWKAKNGAITQKEFGEFGLTYLLYKRKQEDTKIENIQEKIDWIIKMLNYDPNNRNFVCGTPFINSQGEKYVSPKERWHQKVTETLANVRISNDTFESKVENLYELTEHIFNFFQIYPLCEIEQGDNEKIKNTIVEIFEKEYLNIVSHNMNENYKENTESKSTESKEYTAKELNESRQCLGLDFILGNSNQDYISDLEEFCYTEEYSCVTATINNRPAAIIIFTFMYPTDYNKAVLDNLDKYEEIADELFPNRDIDIYALGIGLINKRAEREKKGEYKIGVKFAVSLDTLHLIRPADNFSYGFDFDNPIQLNMMGADTWYMEHIKSSIGEICKLKRHGSTHSDKTQHVLDIWEVVVHVQHPNINFIKFLIYLDSYALDMFTDIDELKKTPLFFEWKE